tara:strand:- start:111 stop:275 length:165 start_codon:yes stop_codon:yes gene_type:complete
LIPSRIDNDITRRDVKAINNEQIRILLPFEADFGNEKCVANAHAKPPWKTTIAV